MNHPTLATVLPRIYEDDVESDWMIDELWYGAVDATDIHDPIARLGFVLLRFMKGVPVCDVTCFEVR